VWVNEAKRQLWGTVGVDGYAGPSEMALLVDDSANFTWAAADVLTQIEHAPDNVAYVVALDERSLHGVLAEMERLTAELSTADVLRRSMQNGGSIVLGDPAEAVELIDQIAPEHVTVAVRDLSLADRIHRAGCVLVGEFSPESAGDYVAGPSHTLPTAGAARWQSPVSVATFLKRQSRIQFSSRQLVPLIPAIAALAEMEGFPAHALAARLRSGTLPR
jgi:histidinol dehydrogenase